MNATATEDLSVEVERKPQSVVELRVEAPASALEAAVDRALRRLAQRVRIPGFRPGKAPGPMVERALGWETVRQEALEELIPQLYTAALEQAGVDAVDDPQLSLTTAERGEPVRFTATVTSTPEVDLGDYLALRVPEERTEITDADIDETIEQVRRKHSTTVDADRPVQAGDVLTCTLVMKRGEETLSDEGERELEVDRERLLPGLADALVGMNAGQQRSFQLTLPEDYAREELRGATVDVDVEVKAVRERQLPPLDDQLAVLDEHGNTLDELREHYRQRLSDFKGEEDREKYEGAVLEALRDQVTIDIPETMVDREVNRQLADMELRLSQMGLPLDRYLELSGSSIEQLRAERREQAVQRVKLELALDALAEAEGLEVDEAAVVREEERAAEGRKLTAAQRRRLHAAAHIDLRRRAAGERLLEICRGEG